MRASSPRIYRAGSAARDSPARMAVVPAVSKANTASRAPAGERQCRLRRIERAVRIEGTPRRNRLVLRGEAIEIVAATGAQTALDLADAVLHEMVVGLGPFGGAALDLRRGFDQFRKRAQGDATGKSRNADLRQPDHSACGETRAGSRKGNTDIRTCDARGRTRRRSCNRCWRSRAAPSCPTSLLDLDIGLGEHMCAKPLLAGAIGDRRGDEDPARERAPRPPAEIARDAKPARCRDRFRLGQQRGPAGNGAVSKHLFARAA